ncbi:MAG: radical SAM protein [Proteobacteria bacterium]|nr:radical SAM protein [Pseudomonadota bacterium]MBU4296648.1 radical SAM protein [Pseudomonadota bacterium]MCG2748441.1 radical SAM protein [Desulfobulbaceae bacterium]
MDSYRIDTHKLMYHVKRVNKWLAGELVYPLYIEMSPAGLCNHRCTFCALDFMGYKKRFLDADILSQRFAEMGHLGVKSVMFGGEGEPLLHRDIGRMTRDASRAGIDVAITTNGVFFGQGLAEEILCCTKWIKVSINAGDPATYARIHNTREDDFAKVLHNLENAVRVKKKTKSQCVLGAQLLLLPENFHEVMLLAGLVKDIGLDYLVIKPYSHHPLTESSRYKNISYEGLDDMCRQADSLRSDDFEVVIRRDTMQRWNKQYRRYHHCRALPFWSYIDSAGNVWGCSMYMGDDRFLYGNIHRNSFQEIWEGAARRHSLHWVENELDTGNCRVNCRMDKVNTYLWELENPPDHVNFI